MRDVQPAHGLGRVWEGTAAHITILLRIGQLPDARAIENDDDRSRKLSHPCALRRI